MKGAKPFNDRLLTANATAISASVTVSMGDDTSGAFSEISLVNGDDRSTSSAVKSMYPGRIIKSLKGKTKKIARLLSFVCKFVFETRSVTIN